jgi:pimeloyl-ACP methyl ester carboxylesterase
MTALTDPVPPDRRSPARRRVRRWLIALVGLTVLWLVGSLVAAHLLTHRKGGRFAEPAPRVSWARFEGVRLPTLDGHELGAWYAEGPAGGPSVVLLHGNGGHRGHHLARARLLAGAGCSVLPVTIRAHGDSSGDYNDIGYSARHDVVAAVSYMERRRPGRPIVVLGSSLGAAAATYASAGLGRRVAGFVLEAPYLDLKSAVRNRTREHLPIGLEWVAYQGLLLVAPLVVPDLEKTSPLLAIGGVPEDVPVLFLAGRHDDKATPEQVERLRDRVGSHARLVVFERAGHLGFLESDPGLYRRALLGLIREAARKPAVEPGTAP